MEIKNYIREIWDFPKKGILFRDITTLLKEPDALKAAILQMQGLCEGLDFDIIVGPESRGFIFGMPMAFNMGKGFVPARKPGKLPATAVSKSYALEYDTATIEIHADAIQKGQRVIIVDDLLATGGTANALAELITDMGGIVCGLFFLIELEELRGRDIINFPCESVLKY